MAHYTKATIFGGTGFLGRYVVENIADNNVTIRVPTRSMAKGYFLRMAGGVGQVVAQGCNIHDDLSVQKAIEGSDWVINLVGALSEQGTSSFEKLHHEFPERLARLCQQSGVKRLVHVSSLGADENAPSLYARTKALGEQAILREFPKATILRPSVMFGPEDRFFNFFAQMAVFSPVLPLIGGGKTQFQPVYVNDVARAIVESVRRPEQEVQGKIFELGGDERYSFKGLLEKLADFTGKKRHLLNIPFGLAKIQGAIFQHLPGTLLTVDQVRQLMTDNVVSGAKPGLKELGIVPETLDAILPQYLGRFSGGRFAFKRA